MGTYFSWASFCDDHAFKKEMWTYRDSKRPKITFRSISGFRRKVVAIITITLIIQLFLIINCINSCID